MRHMDAPVPACMTEFWQGHSLVDSLTVSLASPGIVGASAATEAMSPPMTCTAGCSGAGAWLAMLLTILSTEVAMLAISGIGTA